MAAFTWLKGRMLEALEVAGEVAAGVGLDWIGLIWIELS